MTKLLTTAIMVSKFINIVLVCNVLVLNCSDRLVGFRINSPSTDLVYSFFISKPLVNLMAVFAAAV